MEASKKNNIKKSVKLTIIETSEGTILNVLDQKPKLPLWL